MAVKSLILVLCHVTKIKLLPEMALNHSFKSVAKPAYCSFQNDISMHYNFD